MDLDIAVHLPSNIKGKFQYQPVPDSSPLEDNVCISHGKKIKNLRPLWARSGIGYFNASLPIGVQRCLNDIVTLIWRPKR